MNGSFHSSYGETNEMCEQLFLLHGIMLYEASECNFLHVGMIAVKPLI